MRKKLRAAAIVLCLALLLFSAAQLYGYWQEGHQSEEVYTQLSQEVQLPQSDLAEEENISWPEVDFSALWETGPQIVGWLTCEGTQIHYPVVQGEDNDYYLTHLPDGSYNPGGSLFLDCRAAADFSDAHSIIYGHYMKNGTMFADLTGYKEQAFYDAHPRMLLVTPEGRFTVELFSGYVASVEESAWELDFSAQEEWKLWLEETRERSVFQSEVQPSLQDKVLTLSTCSYEFENARFVVHGILKQAG